jgi:hypothetical protein
MNYEDGIKLLPLLDNLKNKELLLSKEWTIINTALLPSEEGTLTAYIPVLGWAANGQWLTNSINHDFVYKGSGIYYKTDSTYHNDNLTFYVFLKKSDNLFSAEYKCVSLGQMIMNQEIQKEDIPNLLLQQL